VVSWFPTVIKTLLISYSLENTHKQDKNIVDFLLPKIFSSFSYKNIFLRAKTLVFRRFGDPFVVYDRNQWVVVFWERSAIKFFYQCSEDVFSLKIAFVRCNPD